MENRTGKAIVIYPRMFMKAVIIQILMGDDKVEIVFCLHFHSICINRTSYINMGKVY